MPPGDSYSARSDRSGKRTARCQCPGGTAVGNRQRLLAGRVQGIRRAAWPTDSEAADRQVTVRQRLGQLRTRTINRIKHLSASTTWSRSVPPGLDSSGRKWLAGHARGGGRGDGSAFGPVEPVDEQIGRSPKRSASVRRSIPRRWFWRRSRVAGL